MTALPYDSDVLVFLPEEDILKANGIVKAYHNYSWVVCPDRGLVFYSSNAGKARGSLERASPQCNASENITRRLSNLYPWAKVKTIPLVLVPINVSDYA